jgi:hypothetical protein
LPCWTTVSNVVLIELRSLEPDVPVPDVPGVPDEALASLPMLDEELLVLVPELVPEVIEEPDVHELDAVVRREAASESWL